MLIKDLDAYLRELLDLERFARADRSMNGLQVGDGNGSVARVAVAVDACLATFQRAVELKADLLFVHHGLFWGAPLAVTGTHRERLQFLLDNNLSLYAAHLPLDAHAAVGNNAGIADRIGLTGCVPWGAYKGIDIGVKGCLPEKKSVDDILAMLQLRRDECLGFFSFGPDLVKSVGIISGGAANEVEEAIDDGLDLYITGEVSHQIYHACAEAGMNMIAGGHYNTEVYGVQSVARKIKSDLRIETVFIDTPTGL